MSKKAAQRKGKHVLYYANLAGELVDFRPGGPQEGRQYRVSYKDWEAKFKDQLYLIEDPNYVAPPIVRPSKESYEKARALVKATNAKHAAAKGVSKPAAPVVDSKREEALRGVIRRVAKWEGSGNGEDFLKARSWADTIEELWPDLKNEILAEFERVALVLEGVNVVAEKEKTDEQAS